MKRSISRLLVIAKGQCVCRCLSCQPFLIEVPVKNDGLTVHYLYLGSGMNIAIHLIDLGVRNCDADIYRVYCKSERPVIVGYILFIL